MLIIWKKCPWFCDNNIIISPLNGLLQMSSQEEQRKFRNTESHTKADLHKIHCNTVPLHLKGSTSAHYRYLYTHASHGPAKDQDISMGIHQWMY